MSTAHFFSPYAIIESPPAFLMTIIPKRKKYKKGTKQAFRQILNLKKAFISRSFHTFFTNY